MKIRPLIAALVLALSTTAFGSTAIASEGTGSPQAELTGTFSNEQSTIELAPATQPLEVNGSLENTSPHAVSFSLSALAQDLMNLNTAALDGTQVTVVAPDLEVEPVTVTLREFAWGAGMELEMNPEDGWLIEPGEAINYSVTITAPENSLEENVTVGLVLTSNALDSAEVNS